MFRPGRILQIGGMHHRCLRHRHQWRGAGGHHDAADVIAAPLGHRHRASRTGACSRPAAARSDNAADRRQQHRRDLESRHRALDAGHERAASRASTTRRRCCCPMRRAGRGRRAPRPAHQSERGNLLSRRISTIRAAGFAARPSIDFRADALNLGAALQRRASRARARSRASRWSRRARSRTASTWTSASSSCLSPSGRASCTCRRRRSPALRRRATTCCSSSTRGRASVAKIVRMNIGGGATATAATSAAADLHAQSAAAAAVRKQSGDHGHVHGECRQSRTGVMYSWFFDDGTPQTALPPRRRSSHTFTQPGVYYVTVTATRDGSPPQTQDLHPDGSSAADGQCADGIEQHCLRGARHRPGLGRQPGQRLACPSSTPRPTRASRRSPWARGRAVAGDRAGRAASGWSNKLSGTISVIDPQILHGRAGRSRCPMRRSPSASRSRRTAARRSSRSKLPAAAQAESQPRARSSAASPSAPIRATSRSRPTARRSMSRASSARRCRARARRNVQTNGGGEVVVVNAGSMSVDRAPSILHVSTQAGLREPGQRLPNYLGAPVISPDGIDRLGPLEAGQRAARHAAQRAQPQLPEHGARDQLAHRSCRRAQRRLRGAHRPRQLRRRERGGLRSVRRLSVRGAGDQPRSRGGRCLRRLGALPRSTSGARRRASRSRRTARRSTSTTSWTARSASST